MKKIITALLCVCLAASLLTGCGAAPEQTDGKPTVIAATFPQYDWTREILGDRADEVNLELLVSDGVDMHSYQPSTEDIVGISTCDMFIYVGGESDSWIRDVLKVKQNGAMIELNLIQALGDAAKAETPLEGMQADDHGHEEEETDEHVWLSLKNAQTLCRAIAQRLCELDPDGSDVYAANAQSYIEKLDALDQKYQAAVDSAARTVVLFGDRFPFRYMTDDYGLTCYAAFNGCSAETEASFETVAFLAGKADELSLPCILTIEGSSHKIAETISAATATGGQQILALNSMQAVTAADIQNGATYLSIMEQNLETLKTALG